MAVESNWELACVNWTARLAVMAYYFRLILDVRLARCRTAELGHSSGSSVRTQLLSRCARSSWTAGAILNLLHALSAFTLIHGWSQAVAMEHTAEQTQSVIGISAGYGLYVNYAFTLLWIADAVIWWSVGINWPYRSRARFWATHLVFAFIVFNATVVFGPWWWTPVTAIVALVLVCQGMSRR